MISEILEFQGDYRFLSNFFIADFVWNGTLWSHSEAAYQAAKATTREDYLSFLKLTPGQAKRHGREIQVRDDWEEVKYDIMREIVFAKFSQNPELKARLLATGYAHLEEGNNHGDQIWGVCPPRSSCGRNWLGKVLMSVRDELRASAEES
jgi:ribA/ribD-fused uncharacterized protein